MVYVETVGLGLAERIYLMAYVATLGRGAMKREVVFAEAVRLE